MRAPVVPRSVKMGASGRRMCATLRPSGPAHGHVQDPSDITSLSPGLGGMSAEVTLSMTSRP